jgi:hypothetical protein
LAKNPHPVMCSFFFFSNFPHQPQKKHFFCFLCVCLFFFVVSFLGVVRVLQFSTSPIRGRIGQSSLSCPCHLCLAFHTSKYFSCFTSQCRQSGLTQQNRLCATVLDGPDSISSRLAPLHTSSNVFVLHLVMPPHLVPCSVMPYFLFCPP